MKKTILSLIIPVILVAATSAYAWNYQAIKHLDSSAMSHQHPKDMLRLEKDRKITAILIGDSDVDLYLYNYKNGNWVEVARSNSKEWTEILSYQSPSDSWYAWFVVLKSPNVEGGSYFLELADF